MQLQDLKGKQYGQLTVIARAENKGKRTAWRCKCDCGRECIVASNNLKKGHTKSCGCLGRKKSSERMKTHGMRNTRLYRIWTNMRNRCHYEKNINFKDYGGRGIKVCAEWRDSFEVFRYWALQNGYRDNLTIDRIDVNGNYEPKNCRWATKKEQENNTRNNRLLTYEGRTKTMQMWADETGIKASTIWARLKRGWTAERALTEEVHK